MDKRKLLRAFVVVYFDLLNKVKKQSENNNEFDMFYKKNIMLKKTNVKMFIKVWYENMTIPYHEHIMTGNVEHIFSDEVVNNVSQKTSCDMVKYVGKFREKYNNTEPEIVEELLLRVQQLTQLSYNYFNIA